MIESIYAWWLLAFWIALTFWYFRQATKAAIVFQLLFFLPEDVYVKTAVAAAQAIFCTHLWLNEYRITRFSDIGKRVLRHSPAIPIAYSFMVLLPALPWMALATGCYIVLAWRLRWRRSDSPRKKPSES